MNLDNLKEYDIGYVIKPRTYLEDKGGWSFTRWKEVTKIKPFEIVVLGKVFYEDKWRFVTSKGVYNDIYFSLEEAIEECEKRNNEDSDSYK